MTNPITPDPINPDPFASESVTPDPLATDATSAPDPAAGFIPDDDDKAGAQKDKALTPLYAAAGLVEVVATQLRGRLSRTQAQVQAQTGTLPTTTKSRVAELQQQLKTYSDKVAQGYNSLATRGKPTVDSTLVTVRHLSGRAERKVEDFKADAATADPDMPTAQEQVVVEPVIVDPVVDVDPVDRDRTTRNGF